MAGETQISPVAVWRTQLDARSEQIVSVLPAHIPLERFKRTALAAAMHNPNLLTKCDRTSLFNAVMKAATDGLLPDGREGAIVEYKGKAQWLPMIAGIRKKVRQSGEILTWDAHVVYENDHFDYILGDDPIIVHKPALRNRGRIIAAYSIAVLKSGEKSREVMTVEEIEKVREVSKMSDRGPWVEWYEEMAKKTVAKRHSKVLPMNTDLDLMLRREDEDEPDAEAAGKAVATATAPVRGLKGKLAALANGPAIEDHSPEPEPEREAEPKQETAKKAEPEKEPAREASQEAAKAEPAAKATQAPAAAPKASKAAPKASKAQPASPPPPPPAAPPPPPASQEIDELDQTIPHDEDGVVIEHDPDEGSGQADGGGTVEDETGEDRVPDVNDPVAVADARGVQARRDAYARKAVPGEYRSPGREAEHDAWVNGWIREHKRLQEHPGT